MAGAPPLAAVIVSGMITSTLTDEIFAAYPGILFLAASLQKVKNNL